MGCTCIPRGLQSWSCSIRSRYGFQRACLVRSIAGRVGGASAVPTSYGPRFRLMSSCRTAPLTSAPPNAFATSLAPSPGCRSTWPPTRTVTLPTLVDDASDNWLLDTGPLVALLSRDDAAHDRCAATFDAIRGHLLTSEAVLTEAMHLLDRQRAGASACLDFFIRLGAVLVPLTPARLSLCRDLMVRYADTPMDFADATLVAFAEEFSIARVLTLDRRGFVTYRWRRSRRFSIAP
jgi:uncharacterized protein